MATNGDRNLAIDKPGTATARLWPRLGQAR